MKKVVVSLVFLALLSCGDDCKINSQAITNYSAQITVLEQKISETTLEASKAIYRAEISTLKDKIAVEADKCD